MHISTLHAIPGKTVEDMANIMLTHSYDNHVQYVVNVYQSLIKG